MTADGRPSDIKKKVHKLSKNCAVAWTGDLIAASSVIRNLKQQLNSDYISFKELESHLTKLNPEEFGNFVTRLIFWVIDDKEYCFLWNSGYPQELFLGEPTYDGSGQKVIEEQLSINGNISPRDGGFVSSLGEPLPTDIDGKLITPYRLSDIEYAKKSCLNIITQLKTDEALFRKNHELGFGYGYDILIYENGEFRYIDDILYIILTFFINNANKNIGVSSPSHLFKYFVSDEFSIMENINISKRENAFNIACPLGNYNFSDKKKLIETLSENNRNVYLSKYYCLFLNLLGPKGHLPPITMILPSSSPLTSRYIKFEEGTINFMIPQKMIEDIHNTIVNKLPYAHIKDFTIHTK